MTDDNIERTLRTALDAQARRVEVAPDALTKIRARTRKRRFGPGRVHKGGFMVTMGTGAGVLAATAVFAFASVTGGCGSKPLATSPATAPSSPSPSSVGVPESDVVMTVPVYYIGPGKKLYREYHKVTLGSAPANGVAPAVAQLFAKTALDPDYHSGWVSSAPAPTVTVAGGIATINLHSTPGYVSATPTEGAAALQELIWTATAYTGGTGVRILVDGKAVSTVMGQPASGVLHRGPAVDVLAPIWIIDPQQGAQVSNNVTINVAGIVFEAQFSLDIRNSAGAVVTTIPVHLSAGPPSQGTATLHVTLTPGTYTVEGLLPSAKDTSYQLIDNHTFTVK